MYDSVVVSDRTNRAIRFPGLELLAVPILGVIGGLAVALELIPLRATTGPRTNTLLGRIQGATFAGPGTALNGIFAGWILMLPILAVWNSCDAFVPLFLDDARPDRANQWSNVCDFVSGVIAFLVGYAL